MYAITENYKNQIENNTSLSPQSKIIVDGIEYAGDFIKTAPKFKHQNTSLFGGFPTKTCNFEIYDFNNELDFENKEIYVYKGLVVDGEIEYIPQGIFIPKADKISTNISQRSITFKDIQDKSQNFDSQYFSNLDWSNNQKHTGLEIISEVCMNVGVPLGSEEFNWATFEFEQPNFPSNISNREVVSRLAEIGGSIAFINRNGELIIKSPFLTNHTIERKRYEKLTQENQIGPFNTITLGMEGLENDIVYPEEVTGERIEYKILDNPYVSLNPGDMIEEVAKYILGFSYVPFSLTNFVDGFYLDLNDEIEIINKNGEKFTGLLLNYETTGRLKSNIKSEIYDKGNTNYNLAGSTKETIANVRLLVDHLNSLVQSTVQEVDGQNEKITQILQNISEILFNIQNGGGNNLIKNSVGFAGTTEWNLSFDNEETSTVEQIANVDLLQHGVSGGAFQLNGVKLLQEIPIRINNSYSFSCTVFKHPGKSGYLKIYNKNNEDNPIFYQELSSLEEYNYQEFSIQDFRPNDNTIVVELYGEEGSNLIITDSMLNSGSLTSIWTQANGEILNTQVNINMNGVVIKSVQFEQTGQYTVISPLEFAGYANVNGVSTRVFTLNGDTTEAEKIRARSMIAMRPIKIVPNNSGNNRGWAFVTDNGGNT